MQNLIGKEIRIKRGKLSETIRIKKIVEIVPSVFYVSGLNYKRRISVTMTLEEINENIISVN